MIALPPGKRRVRIALKVATNIVIAIEVWQRVIERDDGAVLADFSRPQCSHVVHAEGARQTARDCLAVCTRDFGSRDI